MLTRTQLRLCTQNAPYKNQKKKKEKKRQQQTKTRKAPYESVRTDTDTAGPGAQAVREASVPS